MSYLDPIFADKPTGYFAKAAAYTATPASGLDVTYDIWEMEALEQAKRIVGDLQYGPALHNTPAHEKLFHMWTYLSKRQREIVSEALADPEKAGR